MKQIKGRDQLEFLSSLLLECADHEEDFWTFAVDNEESVRIALYAKSVISGYANPTDKLISECDEAIDSLQSFLDQIDSQDE
jgi:hypothetical protein